VGEGRKCKNLKPESWQARRRKMEKKEVEKVRRSEDGNKDQD
jgi:hypothetical protein